MTKRKFKSDRQRKAVMAKLKAHGGGKKPPRLAGRVPKKGERKGQSIKWGAAGYLKGKKYHEYDRKRDRKIKAKTIRKPGSAPWRGDLKGKRI